MSKKKLISVLIILESILLLIGVYYYDKLTKEDKDKDTVYIEYEDNWNNGYCENVILD